MIPERQMIDNSFKSFLALHMEIFLKTPNRIKHLSGRNTKTLKEQTVFIRRINVSPGANKLLPHSLD